MPINSWFQRISLNLSLPRSRQLRCRCLVTFAGSFERAGFATLSSTTHVRHNGRARDLVRCSRRPSPYLFHKLQPTLTSRMLINGYFIVVYPGTETITFPIILIVL